MKKTFAVWLIMLGGALAQMPDSLQLSSTDSVNVFAILQQQIENARNKKSEVLATEIINAELSETTVKRDKPVEAGYSPVIGYLVEMPIIYKLYLAVSFTIVCFVLVRRTIRKISKSSNRNLKKKIGLMREEKIGGTISNPKLAKIRKVLKENLEIFKQNEKLLAKTAKELNISQGELLLAARLKLYEMKKM